MNIPVVFEDDWLQVADKPPGLLVIPSPKKEPKTLTTILNRQMEQRGESVRLHPCHRLDRETSGLIIFAKGKSMQKRMMDIFKSRQIKKTYLAFVQGVLAQDRGRIEVPIEKKPAITSYQVMERRRSFTIVKILPLTGRTNQIRIHFKNIGHPLVGESRFAFRRDYKLRFKRVCLHCASLEFVHPMTKKEIQIKAGLPLDLKGFLTRTYP